MKSPIVSVLIVAVSVSGFMVTACKSGKGPTEKTSSAGNVSTAGSKPASPALVPMPDDIACSMGGMETSSSIGPNGEVGDTRGSVNSLTCWIDGRRPLVKKDIALVSTSISHGMLPTRDFGGIEIIPENSILSNSFSMGIYSDKIQPLRRYLVQPAGNGEITLLDAAEIDDLARVNALLVAKADVNARQADGATPLIVASSDGYTDLITPLLSAGADMNAKDKLGNTALILATGNNHLDTVRALLAAKADVNIKNSNGSTALTRASGSNGNAALAQVLVAAGADVNTRNKDGDSPLAIASSWGHLDVVQVLLAANADVNARENDGDTALILASGNGFVDVVRALLAAKADVNAKTNAGQTALALASSTGHADIVQLLKSAGALR